MYRSRREFFTLSQSNRTEVVVTHKRTSGQTFYIPWVFSLASNTLSSSLFLSSHSSVALLLLLSFPFFLASSLGWFATSIASRCVIEVWYIININWLSTRACARINEATSVRACIRACVRVCPRQRKRMLMFNRQRCSPKMINKSHREVSH